METAIITTPTRGLVPARLPVFGGSNGTTQLASGNTGPQVLALGFNPLTDYNSSSQMLPASGSINYGFTTRTFAFNTLTEYNSSSQMLPASGSINYGFTGTQTFAFQALNEPNARVQIFPAAFGPSTLTPTYFAIFSAWTKRFADRPAETAVYQLPRRTHLEATAARILVLRSARALRDIVAKHASGEVVFDAIQALYLSHNTARDQQIAGRLITLYRAALEEDENIRPASISQFKEFFLGHPELGLPKITLTPDGTLRARWIHGAGDFIALEFTGEQNAKLVAEIPRDSGLTATHFGSEPLEYIIAVAQGMGASFA